VSTHRIEPLTSWVRFRFGPLSGVAVAWRESHIIPAQRPHSARPRYHPSHSTSGQFQRVPWTDPWTRTRMQSIAVRASGRRRSRPVAQLLGRRAAHLRAPEQAAATPIPSAPAIDVVCHLHARPRKVRCGHTNVLTGDTELHLRIAKSHFDVAGPHAGEWAPAGGGEAAVSDTSRRPRRPFSLRSGMVAAMSGPCVRKSAKKGRGCGRPGYGTTSRLDPTLDCRLPAASVA
jgi:hypothetical protein